MVYVQVVHLDFKLMEYLVIPVSTIHSPLEELLHAQLVLVHVKLVIVVLVIAYPAHQDLDLITSLFSVLPAILQLSQKELLLVLTAT